MSENKFDAAGNTAPMIFGLIGQAMRKIGAIGKTSKNTQQNYAFRGIDAVYNALNPVMSELGLFVCPEILDHRREERVSEKTYNGQTTQTLLKYSILTIKYTIYAPDGSNVSCVVVGEGMDSGDKASNKAMSVALKYACFQLFMIPTQEMVDSDSESPEATSKAQTPNAPKAAMQEKIGTRAPARVEQASSVPPTTAQQTQPAAPLSPVLEYLANEREALRIMREIGKAENNAIWRAQLQALTDAKIVPAKPLADFTQEEAKTLVTSMYKRFAPKGTVLIDDGQSS